MMDQNLPSSVKRIDDASPEQSFWPTDVGRFLP